MGTNPKDCYVTITGKFGANSSQGDSGEGRPPFGMTVNCDEVGAPLVHTTVYMCGDISMKCECKPDASEQYNRIRQSISPLGGWMLIFEMCMRVSDCEYDEYVQKCKKNPAPWRQCIPMNLNANGAGLKAYCACLEKVTGGFQIICGGGAVGSWWDYCRRRMSSCLDETNGTNGYGELGSDLVQEINTGLANWFDTIPDSVYQNWCEDPVMYPGDGAGAALMETLGEANRSALRARKLGSRKTPPITEFVRPASRDAIDSAWTTQGGQQESTTGSYEVLDIQHSNNDANGDPKHFRRLVDDYGNQTQPDPRTNPDARVKPASDLRPWGPRQKRHWAAWWPVQSETTQASQIYILVGGVYYGPMAAPE